MNKTSTHRYFSSVDDKSNTVQVQLSHNSLNFQHIFCHGTDKIVIILIKKMPKTRILVDMDGVLADLEGKLFSIYRTRYPDYPFIQPENRKGMYMDAQYSKDLGEKYGKTIYQILSDEPHLFRDLEPLPNSISTGCFRKNAA